MKSQSFLQVESLNLSPKNTEVSRKAAITFGALTVVALISIILM